MHAADDPIRVVVADDDAAVRTLIRTLLAGEGFEVVGEASNGEEAVAAVDAHRPAVVTMDLEMPIMNGVEATREICASDAPPVVVIVSGSGSSDLVGEALAAGARWHVEKRQAHAQLADVLRAAAGVKHALS